MKEVKANRNIERRNYFRIDDTAILNYRVVDDRELGREQPDSDPVVIDKLTLKARFDSISREMLPLFRRIETGSPEIAKYLSSLDKKLNLLSEYFVESAMGDMEMNPQRINLGAGGISFSSFSPLMVGAMLELRIVLLPEYYGIFTFARVVSCVRNSDSPAEKNPYKISVEFERMGDDVRDVITRHVLNKEQQAIRKA